jgi:hypothetical protein
VQGIALNIDEIDDAEGADGAITFNRCSFKNRTMYNTIFISDKSALKAKVTFNECYIDQFNSGGSVISLETTESSLRDAMTYGGLEFNNCIVNDKYNRNFMTFDDRSATGKGIRDVKGTFTVNNPFGAKYELGTVKQNINVQVKENKSTPPIINISSPLKYSRIEKGSNLTVTSPASDSDVGTTNGAGIEKVIYEIQYAGEIVHSAEDTQAPYTFNVSTEGWQRGIYLVKAIAVSSNLQTRNISVIPFEIVSSDILTAIKPSEEVKNAITLFPNPTKNELFINRSFNESASYEITSIDGKLLQTGEAGEHAINIENLKPGFYIIKIKTEVGETVQRFVKE